MNRKFYQMKTTVILFAHLLKPFIELTRMFKSILVCTSICILISCMTSKRAQNKFEPAANPVVAHRGAFKQNNLPENSIAALRHAIDLKCTGAEFDIHMTADDTLVINHDAEYHGLSIEKNTYQSLNRFQLSNGEKLPTLREYINEGLVNNDHTVLVCEIKPASTKDRGREVADKVVALINDLNARDRVMYISFDYDILLRVLQIQPNANTQYLNGDKSPLQVKADGISGIDYHYNIFRKNEHWIDEAKKNNIKLNVWTVNDSATIDWFLNKKFDYITTNEPELTMRIFSNSTNK